MNAVLCGAQFVSRPTGVFKEQVWYVPLEDGRYDSYYILSNRKPKAMAHEALLHSHGAFDDQAAALEDAKAVYGGCDKVDIFDGWHDVPELQRRLLQRAMQKKRLARNRAIKWVVTHGFDILIWVGICASIAAPTLRSNAVLVGVIIFAFCWCGLLVPAAVLNTWSNSKTRTTEPHSLP